MIKTIVIASVMYLAGISTASAFFLSRSVSSDEFPELCSKRTKQTSII